MKKLLLILLSLPLIIVAQYGEKNEKSQFKTIEINSEMPNMDQKLKSINDYSYSLESISEKNGLIVIFTSNTCPFVIKWEDRYTMVEELAKKNNLGLAYINSNYKKRDGDDSFKKMKEHAKKYNYRAPYLLDTESTLANSFFMPERENACTVLEGSSENNLTKAEPSPPEAPITAMF